MDEIIFMRIAKMLMPISSCALLTQEIMVFILRDTYALFRE
ncbi:hypothetical protein ACRRVD_03450 [Candidatus Cardinium hertigii]